MRRLVVLLLALGLLVGCSGFRQNVIDVSNASLQDLEVKRTVGSNILIAWPMDSEIIRHGLGTNFEQLSGDVLKAFASLDERSAKPIEERTDRDFGAAIGDAALIASRVGIGFIEQYSPSWTAYIPALFGL